MIGFFLTESRSALDFIVRDNEAKELNDPNRLSAILWGLQKSFDGGFMDIAVIDAAGDQETYVGAFACSTRTIIPSPGSNRSWIRAYTSRTFSLAIETCRSVRDKQGKKRMRVLIVDDEADLASALAERLDIRGISADWTTTAEQALAMASATAYDLAVLDVRMPRIGGVELRARLHTQRPRDEIFIFNWLWFGAGFQGGQGVCRRPMLSGQTHRYKGSD